MSPVSSVHPALVPGERYPDSWYAATADHRQSYSSLDQSVRTDICIVGAGLAGLSIGYELVCRGVTVTILEAGRVAWGASGRSGGLVTPGFAADMARVSQRVGAECADRLFDYSVLGVERLRDNIRALSPHSMMGQGELSLCRYPNEAETRAEIDALRHRQVAEAVQWNRAKIGEVLETDRYFDGVFRPRSFHIHPLRYALALAAEFARRSGRLFESSAAVSMQRDGQMTVSSAGGQVICDQVIVCTSGYDQGFYRPVSRSVLPVATHVAVTAPLEGIAANLINTAACIADTRNAGDYYRMIDDRRLLWGGKISTLAAPPGAIDQLLRAAMTDVYPALRKVAIDYSWSGLMGYCRHRMPVIRRSEDGVWVATAFGGHGLHATAMAGDLVASAIAEQDQRWTDFDAFGLDWSGGLLGQAAVQSSYWWMQLKDRLAERRAALGISL